MPTYLPDPTIPEPLYDALVASDEDYGAEVRSYLGKNGRDYNISVTSLNKPIQSLILQKRYGDLIVVDPLKDRWHALMGHVIHWVLEKYASQKSRYYTEWRSGFNIPIKGKEIHVHGMLDLYDREKFGIEDWKLTSAGSMVYPKTAYERQLNLLGVILKKNGYRVDSLVNNYLFPHLDKTKHNQPNYPKRNMMKVPVPMERQSKVIERVTKRTALYISQMDKRDQDLIPCSDEERWIRGSLFKGYLRKKGGRKGELQEFRSTVNYKAESLHLLKKWQVDANVSDDDFKIVEVKGEPKYCGYCEAAPFCHQFQRELRKKPKL